MIVADKSAGNVLFLILIAVALFAALSYAVTTSTRSGGGDATKEKTELMANQVVQYATMIDTTLQRMRISDGKQFWQMDYSCNTIGVCASANATCTSNSCRLFSDKGGTVPFRLFGAEFLGKNYMSVGNTYADIKLSLYAINGVGTTQPEVVLGISGLSNAICKALNQKLIDLDQAPTITYTGGAAGSYSGTMTQDPSSGRIMTNTVFNGRMSGCFNVISGQDWSAYYHVLSAR